ncbi:SixA phosphatase family protein [Rhodovibrionaceae bacterium A322]
MSPQPHQQDSRQILCLRHAKSSWNEPALSDHDRPLNGRGRAAATFMGEWMVSQNLLPDLVLCSSAERTQETWARVAAAFPKTCEVQVSRDLYLASNRALLARIRQAPDSCQRVLLIGHNPGMEMLVADLANPDSSDPKALRHLREKYPTATLAQLDWTGESWAALQPGRAVLTDLSSARALMSPE